MIVYFNGKYLPLDEVKISPFDRGFQFADGVYETLRTYNGRIFCYQAHIDRLKYSLNELNFTYTSLDEFDKISFDLAKMNEISGKDFSVYIQLTRGVQIPRRHNYQENLSPTVFVTVSEIKDNHQNFDNGVKVILEEDIRWTRCDIKSISILPSVLAKTKAVKFNAYETIFHRDNLITEGSHTNFFGVKDGVVFTAPLSNFILKGVTREVIINLCIKNKIPIKETYIKINDIELCNEFFITGTMTEVTPVVQINDRIVDDCEPGKLTRKIKKLFREYILSNKSSV